VEYSVCNVDDWIAIEEESLGSKRKVWLEQSEGERWLFKYSRMNSGSLVGEHWAEKIAAEVAAVLAVPHAQVEFASRDGLLGVISKDFTASRDRGALVLGNELLFRSDPGYARDEQKPSTHTVKRVMAYLRNPRVAKPGEAPETVSVRTAADVFVGYLMLDAIVGNTDRHHENWGILRTPRLGTPATLAPSFDHASSLGRELSDDVRIARLSGKVSNRTVERYCVKGRSSFYSEGESPRQLSVREAFVKAREIRPGAAAYWLSQLRRVSEERLMECVQRVSGAIMSSPMKEFACKLLEVNRRCLLEMT